MFSYLTKRKLRRKKKLLRKSERSKFEHKNQQNSWSISSSAALIVNTKMRLTLHQPKSWAKHIVAYQTDHTTSIIKRIDVFEIKNDIANANHGICIPILSGSVSAIWIMTTFENHIRPKNHRFRTDSNLNSDKLIHVESSRVEMFIVNPSKRSKIQRSIIYSFFKNKFSFFKQIIFYVFLFETNHFSNRNKRNSNRFTMRTLSVRFKTVSLCWADTRIQF